MRISVGLGLCFTLVSCTGSPAMSIVEVSPSSLSEADLPREVTIRGQGLGQAISVSVDDHANAAVTKLSVALGDVPVEVLEHSAREEVRVWVTELDPGDYDLRLGAGSAQTVLRNAFHVSSLDATESISVPSGDSAVASQLVPSADDDASVSTANTSTDERVSTSIDASSPSDPTSSSRAVASSSLTSDAAIHAIETRDAASLTVSSNGGDAAASDTNTPLDGGTNQPNSDTSPDAASPACISSTRLFIDDYESGDFDAWTSSDTTGSCQTTSVDTAGSVSGSRAFHTNITCGSSSDHENYGALQFSGDNLLSSHQNSGLGIDAPNGVLINFWARVHYEFDVGDGEWLALLVLSGTCDWSDTVFSLGMGNTSSSIAISHSDVGGGSETPFAGAPDFPQDTWAKVTAYVNYHTSTFVVWQDGQPVTQAAFVRPGTTLCHIRIGAYVSADTDTADVHVDDVDVWKLGAPLSSFESAPCATDE